MINDKASPDVAFHLVLASPFPPWNNATEAETIDIDVRVGPELVFAGGASNVSTTLRNVQGNASFNVTSRVTDDVLRNMSANPGVPVFASVDVTVVYTDDAGARPRTIQRSVTFPLNYRAPATLDALGATLAGFGGAGVIGLTLYVGRRARLEELYLMHDSGMLIRHWTRTQGAVRDTDIMSGMFIVLQEFVRDSFNDRQNNLERLRFGRKQVAMARGSHAVLAAVVRGRYLSGLPGKLRDAVADFEGHYADVLEDWDGTADRFPGVDIVAWRFMKSRPGGTAS
ncbi:MAG: hypothetical protein ACT4OI_03055 [Methanobacteriota archaeon]